MSERDYSQHHPALPKLEGRECFLTLAMSSLKIHIDKNQKRGTYIWIDPPWTMTQNDQTVVTSDSYPDHKAQDYEERHEQWCSQFGDVFDSRIKRIHSTKIGALKVELDHGWAFEVPAVSYQPPEEDDWYDHWYIRDGTEDRA